MTRLLFIWVVFLPTILFGQTIVIDSCGLNTNKSLNKYESDYFNKALEKQRSTFNFADKKIGFAYGTFGKTIVSKKSYFDRWGRSYFKSNGQVGNELLILTPEEKIMSGDFDAIIVSWSKLQINDKHRQKIIKRLKNKNK